MNGGRVSPADVTVAKRESGNGTVITTMEKYEAIVRKQQDAVMNEAKHWRWFETENMISGRQTGTSVALDALGRTRKIS